MTALEKLQWDLTDLLSELHCARFAGEDENSSYMLDLKDRISILERQIAKLRTCISKYDRDER